MKNRYTKRIATPKVTPQREPVPGRNDMVENNAGAYGFAVADEQRLKRFLVLGTEGGTFYVNENKLVKESAEALRRCIQKNGKGVVDMVVDVSFHGKAYRNDPALFCLAVCMAEGSPEVKSYAAANLQRVARIGTHLFHFLEYANDLRGWGKTLRRAVAKWYESMPPDKLALQVVKYQQRDGWSHKDALRLSHPKAEEPQRNAIFRYIVGGMEAMGPRVVEGSKIKGGTQITPERKYSSLKRVKVPEIIKGVEAVGVTPPVDTEFGTLKRTPGSVLRFFSGAKFWPLFTAKGHTSTVFEECQCCKGIK